MELDMKKMDGFISQLKELLRKEDMQMDFLWLLN